ncbi:PA2169 family four-helix-bundle protein [Nevskia soli]|uniref:PA2169 family four-helix-bundle protein n=1 Tax=Nevskia soli TaxID=418856 RepID=UPI0004A779FB|nr:PA2169 family four-helix-bundle protein [Nevskia soli]
MNDLDTITLLNRLIVTSRNGESALRAAASEAHHAELKQSLQEYSLFFAEAVREMQDTVHKLGGHPKGLGTFDNTLHRTFMHLRALVEGRDEGAILDSVESDEREADICFDDAVNHWDTSPEVHAMLERQRDGARQRHQAIRAMRGRLDTLH